MWSPPERFDEYQLLRRLGHGGMGHVYMARDTLLERDVAIKFVIAVDDPLARARFLVEARAIARLQHPNVVAVHRVGEVLGQPYIVSELVRGRTLDKLNMPVSPDMLLRIALDLARGLAAAHRHGVLHRDVKPANAILSDDGATKLLDFGLAKLDTGDGEPTAGAAGHEVALALEVMQAADTVPPPPGRLPPTTPGDARLGLDASDPLTGAGAVIGTPLYMAPERWFDEPATARSDIYSLGALLFHLAAGRPPRTTENLAKFTRVLRPAPPIRTLVELDPRFGAVIDRCLQPAPADRFESADAVCAALGVIASRHAATVPQGNPYRGLLAFHSEHRDVFFGRAVEIQSVVERLRVEPIVVVVGDSGVGKSSFVRAGVVPEVEDGAFGGPEPWSTVVIVPGRRPLAALTDALAQHLDLDVSVLREQLSDEPTAVAREIGRRRGERGAMLLVIDQLEELVETTARDEAIEVADLLSRLTGPWPGLRVIATLRSDCLARVAELGELRDPLTRGLYLLPPLDERAIRAAIVDPARLCGVTFETDALVDVLVEAGRARGSLPLLQFTLARLWDARDVERNVILSGALHDLGGVEGALAGHADGVIAHLVEEDRGIARQILTRLVSPTGSRVRRTQTELGCDTGRPRRVLEALVHGRLLATEEGHYTLAHEALVRGWRTLRRWLESDALAAAARDRVEHAAAEWLRLERSDDLLWSGRRLQEAETLDRRTLNPPAREFLATARRAARRRRRRRGVLVAASVLSVAGALVGWRVVAQQRLDRAVAAQLARADGLRVPAIALVHENQRERDEAFAAFDAGTSDRGDQLWAHAEALARDAENGLQAAARVLEDAIALDPERALPRQRLADTLFERILLAERTRRPSLVVELLDRLERVDPGGAGRRGWLAPGRLTVQLAPSDASLQLERRDADGWRAQDRGTIRPGELSLAPGSYRFTARAPAHAEVRFPLEVRRGEAQTVRIALPRAADVPTGWVYVPAGEVYSGTSADEVLRTSFLDAPPIHRRPVGAFFIARDETTFAQWIEFLESLSDAERASRLPRAGIWGNVSLQRLAPNRYRFSMTPNDTELHADSGQPLEYPGRTSEGRKQDWMRFPVTGVSIADVEAYARWLHATGRVRGARACTELEWQRAARGADDRLYPHGDILKVSDANIMLTHGGDRGFGLDEIGRFPASDSPFGLHDMAGNAWELSRTVGREQVANVRGGGANSSALEARSDNRVKAGVPDFRGLWVGVRMCADAPPR